MRCKLAAVMAGCLVSACGVQGPPDTAVLTQPVDMHGDLGPVGGSTVLAAPAGWTPAPDPVTPVFRASAPALLAAMREALLARPRTWQTADFPAQLETAFIVRSVAFNFPDIVIVQAIPAGDGASKAVIFSQSRYDSVPFVSDNRARVDALVADLKTRFGTAP